MSFGIETLCLDRFCSIRIEFDVTELDDTVCCDINASMSKNMIGRESDSFISLVL